MKTRHFKCCLCGGIKTKPGRCPECKRLPEFECAEGSRLKAAIRKTIRDNRHLADGDDCTLIDLKNALKNKPCQPRALR